MYFSKILHLHYYGNSLLLDDTFGLNYYYYTVLLFYINVYIMSTLRFINSTFYKRTLYNL